MSKENWIVNFQYGLPGFESLTSFSINNIPEYEPFCVFQSQEEPDVSMIIAEPEVIQLNLKNYIPSEIKKQLEITSDSELKLFIIFCFNNEKHLITANLKAPIVINSVLNIGQQVILDNPELNVNYQVVKGISE